MNITFASSSPSGMIEGTPQLHANAWRVSSTCFAPVHVPMVDPCNINQQNSESFFLLVNLGQ